MARGRSPSFGFVDVSNKPKFRLGIFPRHLYFCFFYLWINAPRIPSGLEKLLAEQHYLLLFYMSLLGVVGMVGIVDLI